MMDAEQLLRSLRATVELRLAELVALENAIEIIETQDVECPGDSKGERQPCFGILEARTCNCGLTTARCANHGGSRAATYFHTQHAAACTGSLLAELIVVRDIDLPSHGGRKQ